MNVENIGSSVSMEKCDIPEFTAISEPGRRLRILTYMCPEIPVDIFALIRSCLEEATGLEADLCIEDRFTGPPPDRTDPFEADLADIVVLHSSDFLRLKALKHTKVELCPAAPFYDHPHAPLDRPVYFSEIIIHAANKEKYKDIKDLKGCSWAYNDDSSLSGNLIVLHYLRNELKTNATFFGSIVQSGSHLESIRMVRDYRVQAAAVDSTVLAGYLREHEDHKDNFISLESLGPLPVYPFLFKSSLPGELKEKITTALLSMHESSKWGPKLINLGILKFVPVNLDLYNLEEDIRKESTGMRFNTAYY